MLKLDLPPELSHEDPGKWVSLALTLLMHAVLALILFYGVQWQRRPVEPVQVDLIRDLPPLRVPVPQPEVPPPPPPKVVEPTPPPPVAKPDIALPKAPEKKKEPPKKEEPPRKEEVPKKEPPPKTPEKPREPARPDTPKPPEGLSARERELLNMDADKVRRQAVAQNTLKSQVLADLQAEGVKRSQFEWIDLIAAKVRGNLAVAAQDITGKPTAEISLELLPDRSIKEGSVRLLRSTGNAVLDKAIQNAIYKSSPLPAPTNPDAFDRSLHFIFRPFG